MAAAPRRAGRRFWIRRREVGGRGGSGERVEFFFFFWTIGGWIKPLVPYTRTRLNGPDGFHDRVSGHVPKYSYTLSPARSPARKTRAWAEKCWPDCRAGPG
jgi:hypothetical protein